MTESAGVGTVDMADMAALEGTPVGSRGAAVAGIARHAAANIVDIPAVVRLASGEDGLG